jgi:histidine triad (HIT) family protein
LSNDLKLNTAQPFSDDCLFCKIGRGSLAAAMVYEDEAVIAFLDNHPLFPGHVLLCPRAHYSTFMDVPPDLVEPLFRKGQLLTQAVETALEAEGTFLAINNRVSQTVPHLHIHIVPRRRRDGLKGFFWPRHKYESEQAIEAARSAIEREARKLMRSNS